MFGSVVVGVAGSHVLQDPSFLFQNHPSLRFHRHFVRRLPTAMYPG